jgi:hypothetical protein
MVVNWVASLKEKTGRSLEQWLRHVEKEGPGEEEERRAWLKEQGLGANAAWWIAERAAGRGGEEDTPEGYLAVAPKYVDAMYGGKRAALRPVHDALIKLARSLGKDVRICPCKTIVPLYRAHVFAEIKPATNTRIDLGLALKDTKAAGPLIDTGGFRKKDRITHRIPIASADEIDKEVERWLRKAYAMDA